MRSIPGLLSHHTDIVDNGSDWSAAKHWVFSTCPKTTNAVECHNRESKEKQILDLERAFLQLYRIDKAVVLCFIAASKNTLTIYPSCTSIGNKQYKKKSYPADKNAEQQSRIRRHVCV